MELRVLKSDALPSVEEQIREDVTLMSAHEKIVYGVNKLVDELGWATRKAAPFCSCSPSTLGTAFKVKRAQPALYKRFESGEITFYRMRLEYDGKHTVNPTESRQQKIQAIRQLAAQGHTAEQIASEIRVREGYVRETANREGIALPDHVFGSVHRINSRRVIEETVTGVEALAMGVGVIQSYDGIPKEDVARWADTMATALKRLQSFRKRLLEVAYRE